MISTKKENFPLAGLDTLLLEKIIAKMDGRSYIQMQQTCHAMADVIQKSKIENVLLEGYLCLVPDARGYKIQREYYDSPAIDPKTLTGFCVETMEVDSGQHMILRGRDVEELENDKKKVLKRRSSEVIISQINQFNFGSSELVEFYGSISVLEWINTALKYNRITCSTLEIEESGKNWTPSTCLELLKVLKPQNVIVCGKLTRNTVRGLIAWPSIKNLKIYCWKEEALLPVAALVLSIYENIEIIFHTNEYDGDDSLYVFSNRIKRQLIQALFTRASPSLKFFDFEMSKTLSPLEVDDDDRDDFFSPELKLPSHFPKEAKCTVTIGTKGGYQFSKISYRRE